MLPSEIDNLLSKTDIILDSITWHKLIDRASDTVAEYEGTIHGKKVFLHLKSYETSNYWAVTYPDRCMSSLGQGIILFDYDLYSITKLIISKQLK